MQPAAIYTNACFNALQHLTGLSKCMSTAEKAQSDMDPIEGPGSREWEILNEKIQNLESDFRLAMDCPGELEATTPEKNTIRLYHSLNDVSNDITIVMDSDTWNDPFIGRPIVVQRRAENWLGKDYPSYIVDVAWYELEKRDYFKSEWNLVIWDGAEGEWVSE